MTRRFTSAARAARFVAPRVDRRAEALACMPAPGVWASASVVELGQGRFTNHYTVRWDTRRVRARLCACAPKTTAFDVAQALDEAAVVCSGGFFFLADVFERAPRVSNLNLCIDDGRLVSAPSADQEALIVRPDGTLELRSVRALGVCVLGGREVRWAGSRTSHEAECVVFGTANCVIEHRRHPELGRARVLDETSRFTPAITERGTQDLGLVRVDGAAFRVVRRSEVGRVDLFEHDMVLRCPSEGVRVGDVVTWRDIDGLEIEPRLDAISTGPLLSCPDFDAHPRNEDRCMGSFPLLRGARATRLALYLFADGVHAGISLLDGRSGSDVFTGVTMDEAVSIVRARGDIAEGCFLDSGHTSKMVVRTPSGLISFGNRHYLRWPTPGDSGYVWVPEGGRPTASLLALVR